MKTSGRHAYLCAIAALTVFCVESLAGGPHACCSRDGTCFPLSDCASCNGLCHENQGCDSITCVAGACCYPDGGCESVTVDACAGAYRGDNISCSPNPCPQPTACCFPDGHCEELLISTCKTDPNNIVFNGEVCGPNPCPQPTGACCGGSFTSCTVTDRDNCTSGGGSYSGDSTTCATHPCGACCEEDCQVLPRAECEAAGIGHTYMGDNTTCDASTCLGGCCDLDGSCMDGLFSDLDCGNDGGVFIGPGTTCTETLCAPLTAQPCCFDDGGCQELPKIACEDQGGGSVDGVRKCTDADCPQPQACCFADGTCQDLIFTRCNDAGGLHQGSTCDPNPCQPAPANDSCDTATEIAIGGSASGNNQFATEDVTTTCGASPAGGGVWYKVVGNGETLTATTCNPGTDFDTIIKVFCNCENFACVGGNDDDPNCTSDSTVSWCSEPGKTYYIIVGGFVAHRGNFELSVSAGGALCAPHACSEVPYACCFDHGGCDEMLPEVCEGLGGLPQEANSTCVTVDCPSDRGACCDGDNCFDNGGEGIPDGDCVDIIQGTYLGNGTTCASASCDDPTGACCQANGTCTNGVQASCRGAYRGDGTTCTPALCPQPSGACCMEDETCVGDVAPGDCLSQNGTYQGHDLTCDAVNCAGPPVGACCLSLEDGSCTLTTETDCPGAYRGDGITCESDPCLLACCTPTGCREMPPGPCDRFGVPHDLGSTCTPDLCNVNVGACCVSGACEERPQLECQAPFAGVGTTCPPSGECLGACCLNNGTCVEELAADCAARPGAFQGFGVKCDPDPCPPPQGACCNVNIGCYMSTEADCITSDDDFQGPGTTCDENACRGACCPGNSFSVIAGVLTAGCEVTTGPACQGDGGDFQGFGTTCETNICQRGACCFEPPVPIEFCDDGATAATCTGAFTSFHPDMTCAEIGCGQPLPTGACCRQDGSCEHTFEFDCDPQTSMFQGVGTTCDPNKCPQPARGRVSASQKGSLLMFSKVELRWATGPAGALRQDTVLELTNDFPEEVCVQLYFVNGDGPLDPVLDPVTGALLVEGEPGWEWVDCQLCLTPDETTYWSAATGLPAGCQPFTVLDPSTGSGPGRPDPTSPGERHLRGFVYAWAVDQAGHAISWNHLSGAATLVNYFNTDAWDYNAWAFRANQTCTFVCDAPDRCENPREVCTLVAHGDRVGQPGRIRMDGHEYEFGYDMLLMDFFASESRALGSGATVITSDTDLTLHPITADLRQDSIGPVTTKAEFAIWNENERRFSGTTRCITCWDQTLLSLYGNRNHFLRANLQTDKGKARIDGVRSDVCDLNCVRERPNENHLDINFILDILGIEHVCSFDASMLGVVAKTLTFSGAATARATAGRNLVGMGTQGGWIKWDIVAPPGTARGAAEAKPIGRGGR